MQWKDISCHQHYWLAYHCLLPGVCYVSALQWRHNGRDGVSNHQRLHCLLNCWFSRRFKKNKNIKLRVTGLCVGHRWPVNSPHKMPVTRKLFLLDAVITVCDWYLSFGVFGVQYSVYLSIACSASLPPNIWLELCERMSSKLQSTFTSKSYNVKHKLSCDDTIGMYSRWRKADDEK